MLHGISAELAHVDRLLSATRAGHGRVLVIRGEVGSGKTALLRYAEESAAGLRVIRAAGIESESEIPYASLQLLLRDFTGRIDELSTPNTTALRRALRLGEPIVGKERLLVGMAALSLLALVAAERPLLCLVDDMQWVDRASADVLAFAARRFTRHPVSLLGASRLPVPPRHAPCPALPLTALDHAAAIHLLDEYAPGLSDRARAAVVRRADGNPLALIELARALTPDERAGDVSPFALRCAPDVEVVAEVRRLPDRTQTMLALAAAASAGALDPVMRAGRVLGLTAEDLGPAEHAALIRLTERSFTFPHPLVEAAAYTAATLSRRTAVHRALATVLTSPAEAGSRAWHLALATTTPDEATAAELERVALAGAGEETLAGYRRAVRLTPDDRLRAGRLMKASRTACTLGHLRVASDLAEEAARLADEPAITGEVAGVRAEIELRRGATGVAARALLAGARLVGHDDPARASAMLTRALRGAWLAADVTLAADCADLLAGIAPGRPEAQLATGLVALLRGDHARGYPMLHAALAGEPDRCPDQLLAGWAHLTVLDGPAAAAAARSALGAPDAGRNSVDRLEAARILAYADIVSGQHGEAARTLDAADGAALDAPRAVLAALAGDGERYEDLCLTATGADACGDSTARWAGVLFLLGKGEYANACSVVPETPHPLIGWFHLADTVDAAVRADGGAQIAARLERLREWTQHFDSPLAEAVLARCEGVADRRGERLEASVDLAEKAENPFEHARSLLAYGQWLRRSRHKAQSRDRLRQAVELFTRLGARPWADHAGLELRAAGDVRQARSDRLTPQEHEVVRLAATGATNRQIASMLFLSPRTVGYHLYKAYPKLGVESRRDLLRMDLDPSTAGPSSARAQT